MRSAPTVASGAAIDIYAGGVGIGTVLLGPGGTAFPGAATEYVFAGGEAIGTTVSSGTVDDVYGTAVNPSVSVGGLVSDSGIVIYSEADGTAMTFAGIITGSGKLVQSGPGSLAVTGDFSVYTGTISIGGGTLEVATPLLGATSIGFEAAASGRLQLDGQTAPSATISGFAVGDVIDLNALAFGGLAAPTVSGMAVTVVEGGAGETLIVAGATADRFILSDDGAGGTNVQIACYCAGTLILTDRGEVSVERLMAGDQLVTVSGVLETVRWIGRRSYAGRFLAGKSHLLPVRIRAGALGNGLPRRDLLISPCHALFIDGILVPAICLVNNLSIVQEQHRERVDYIHIELAQNDVILAEGAPSETFLDDDSRGIFHNAGEFAALYPDAPHRGPFYAPRMSDGYQLEAIRLRLALMASEVVLAA